MFAPDASDHDPTRIGPAVGVGDGASDQGRKDPEGDEAALLAGFDRLCPQGTLPWGFDDAMRRIAQPDGTAAASAAPWRGLPDDLWERGRSARIGRRFVGDVAGVIADLLAADARVAADAAVAGVNVATWDALRYLAARVALLEARLDPTGLEAAELPMAAPDLREWAGVLGSWLGSSDPESTVIVGESGDGTLLRALHGSGMRVQGVEPRGGSAWASLTSEADEAHGTSGSIAQVVFAEVIDHLRRVPDGSSRGVVLAGCVDRVDLAGKVTLLDHALRVTRAGGVAVVLCTDQEAWDGALSHPARDLVPGRPLHPETWSLLLRRTGATDVVWHPPSSGTVHALVASVDR